MKKFSIIFLSLLFVSCGDSILSQFSELDEPFRLKFGQRKILLNDELIVGFDELVEDSRCPIDLKCFWAGIGIIEISLSRDGTDLTEINLATYSSPYPHLNAYPIADTLGYRITLLQLDPYPNTKKTRKISDYEALMKISKLGN